jgi:hypothetical protein
MTTITPETPYYTVEQASRWLTCAQPVPLTLLQRLGKDCSMVCRIRGATFVDVPVQGKSWPTERGYPAAIIQEVFLANPDTRDHVPKPAPRAHQLVEVPGAEGLTECTACGGAEGALPTECPGERLPADALRLTHAGEIDFLGGKWVKKASA